MQVVWNNYIQAMRQAGFSSAMGVYVASGLLTYGASQGAHTISTPSMASVHHTDQLLGLSIQAKCHLRGVWTHAASCVRCMVYAFAWLAMTRGKESEMGASPNVSGAWQRWRTLSRP